MSHCFGVCPCQGSSIVLESHSGKYRQIGVFAGCKYCRFHFMKVGDRFNEYDVCAGLGSCEHLTLEYLVGAFKTQVAYGLNQLAYWTDVQSHKLSARRAFCQSYGLPDDILNRINRIFKLYFVCSEGIGSYYIGACF